MASKNKLRKLQNAIASGGVLKNKIGKLKRLQFYTASERKHTKQQRFDVYDYEKPSTSETSQAIALVEKELSQISEELGLNFDMYVPATSEALAFDVEIVYVVTSSDTKLMQVEDEFLEKTDNMIDNFYAKFPFGSLYQSNLRFVKMMGHYKLLKKICGDK